MPVQTQAAEYLILEAQLPGSAPIPIGVLLHDPGPVPRLGIKLRRDWDRIIGDEEDLEVFEMLAESLEQQALQTSAATFLAKLEDSLSNTIRVSERRPVMMAGFDATLAVLYKREIPSSVIPFRTHLPLYRAEAAAGGWSADQRDPSADDPSWVEVPDSIRLTPDMFAAKVVGRSMEPLIPDGALCLFRANVAGSRENRLLLIENRDSFSHRYTVKRYKSFKNVDPQSDQWSHARIRLEPLNPEFDPWDLGQDSELRVLGEFVLVLEPEPLS